MIPAAHRPVLVAEVLEALAPRDRGVYLDGTFGAGGYSRALLEAAPCTVWGIDRDPEAVARGARMAEAYPARLSILEGRFGDTVALLRNAGVTTVDGVVLDLGVSSMQLDNPERGFSFRLDGPLDMRMGNAEELAADVVNHMGEKDLADIIFQLGEERASRRIARAIVAARRKQPITRTGELAALVRRAVGHTRRGIDAATLTFQALRIYVNDELGELDRGLEAAEALLAPEGRLAVVSFHSLEDKRVKAFLQARSGSAPRGHRHLPDTRSSSPPATFRRLGRGIVRPSPREVDANPRARSARLRAAQRTAAPPWPRSQGRRAA